MSIKLLTGEMIHKAFLKYEEKQGHSWNQRPWERLLTIQQEPYNTVAETLNQELGLVAQQLEINPPLQGEPSAQWLWSLFNSEGEIADTVVLPSGMTFEEYSAKLKEEMRRYKFVLYYENYDGNHGEAEARLLSELNDLINENVPIATPDRRYSYSIQVFKDNRRVGYGAYYRTWDGVKIVEEMDHAKGLNDLLNYEYTFKHAHA